MNIIQMNIIHIKTRKEVENMNIIRVKRKQENLTQKQLAKMVCVDTSTVAKWECGKSIPRMFTLIRLSKIFQCSIDELIDKEVNNVS